jgi:hypothetical protein
MDVKKFGWMLVLLGVVLGLVCAYYSMIPYFNRWDDFDVISEATKAGYATREYLRLKAAQAVNQQRMFMFGWGAAISSFIGWALIVSSKKPPQRASPIAIDQSVKTFWVCGKCNETTDTAKNTCWSCGAPKV